MTVAKALQCPDCGHRHPLGEVADLRTFRCRECRRLLKVPRGAEEAAVSPNGGRRGEEDATMQVKAERPDAKRVPPSQRRDAIAVQRRRAGDVAPRRGISRAARVVVWTIAVPVGLVPVLLVGRAVGLLTVDRAIDVFVGVGVGRFLVPLLVLPVWAAVAATLAHVTIEWLERRKGGRVPARPGSSARARSG